MPDYYYNKQLIAEYRKKSKGRLMNLLVDIMEFVNERFIKD